MATKDKFKNFLWYSWGPLFMGSMGLSLMALEAFVKRDLSLGAAAGAMIFLPFFVVGIYRCKAAQNFWYFLVLAAGIGLAGIAEISVNGHLTPALALQGLTCAALVALGLYMFVRNIERIRLQDDLQPK